MIAPTAPLMPNPDVVSTTLANGESVLMHMGTASYFTLNRTGAQIWVLLGEGLPLTAIADQLVADYEVSAAQAAQSVQTLVDQLAAQQLVCVGEERQTS